jgi:phage I-like protein
MSDAAKPTKSRQSPPAAPVSRTPVGSEGTRPGVIRLTADEVEAAKISGISPQEYYRLKMQDRNRN